MKKPIAWFSITAALFVLRCGAFARVDETIEQLDNRYGPPYETGTTPFHTEFRQYRFKGLLIFAHFFDGKCIGESYENQDHSALATDIVQGLLSANAGASKWNEVTKNGWQRADERFVALNHQQPGDQKFGLIVCTPQLLKAIQVRKNAKEKELNGF
jgi:hypothetical protein